MDYGRRIYYDSITGLVLVDTGERRGAVISTTVSQDIAAHKVLYQRVRSTFDVLELPFGALAQDFQSAQSYRVNPSTKKVEFSYPDPSAPTVTPVPQPSLSESLQALSDENAELLMQNAMQDVSIATLQDENAEFMMRIAMLEMGGTANV